MLASLLQVKLCQSNQHSPPCKVQSRGLAGHLTGPSGMPPNSTMYLQSLMFSWILGREQSCPSQSGNQLLGGPMSLCNVLISLALYIKQVVYLESDLRCKGRPRRLTERQNASTSKEGRNTSPSKQCKPLHSWRNKGGLWPTQTVLLSDMHGWDGLQVLAAPFVGSGRSQGLYP